VLLGRRALPDRRVQLGLPVLRARKGQPDQQGRKVLRGQRECPAMHW
jgi:hypothetical protein